MRLVWYGHKMIPVKYFVVLILAVLIKSSLFSRIAIKEYNIEGKIQF